MKKLLALALSLVLVVGLFGCGAKTETPAATTAAPAAETTAAAETEAPAASATGSVYYLNFKPESDAAWQELAKTYTADRREGHRRYRRFRHLRHHPHR